MASSAAAERAILRTAHPRCGVPKLASWLQIPDFLGPHRALAPHSALPADPDGVVDDARQLLLNRVLIGLGVGAGTRAQITVLCGAEMAHAAKPPDPRPEATERTPGSLAREFEVGIRVHRSPDREVALDLAADLRLDWRVWSPYLDGVVIKPIGNESRALDVLAKAACSAWRIAVCTDPEGIMLELLER